MIHINQHMTFGVDPEMFLRRDGKIVASSEGLPNPPEQFTHDGVQLEFVSQINTCRGNFINEIVRAFYLLRCDVNRAGLTVDFSPVIEIDEETFAVLPDECKRFGCAPSLNLYDSSAVPGVDPSVYRLRSAGGHVHMGGIMPHMNKNRLVALLDIFLGIPSVLLDRDPLAAERRKVYGRAGEYRIPSDSRLEYRTLSNFWLRGSPLISFVIGMARSVFCMEQGQAGAWNQYYTERTYYPYPAVDDLLKSIEVSEVILAINENDFDRAWRIWEVMRPWIKKNLADSYNDTGAHHPLCELRIAAFEQLVEDGIEKHWPLDSTLQRLSTGGDGHYSGWESFCQNIQLKDAVSNMKGRVAV